MTYNYSAHQDALNAASFITEMKDELWDKGQGRLDLDDAFVSINNVLADYEQQRNTTHKTK